MRVEARKTPRLEALARFAADAGANVQRVPRGELDRLAGGVAHQGVVAEAPDLVLHELRTVQLERPLWLVLDGITDPRNFGAILRSAVALGAGAVIWGEHHAAPLTPSTFRASAGAVEHATLVQVRSLRGAVEELATMGITTVALDGNADDELPDLDLSVPLALVVGAEDTGVSRGVRKLCTKRARLPMTPVLDSLNASVAASLALYEAQRQRREST